MATVVVTLEVTVDGASLFGAGPLVRRYEAPALVHVAYEKAADNDATTFAALPATLPTSSGACLVRTNETIALRLNGQTDAGVTLNPAGLLLVLDGDISAVTINNPAEDDVAPVDAILAGA